MRFFALETDQSKIIKEFCLKDEKVVYQTYYHALSFLFAIIREIFITITFFIIGIVAWSWGWPMYWVLVTLATTWFLFVLFNLLKAYIDWAFDMIIITTDKVILVDQTSFLKQEINPIHIENIGSVTTKTQFWNTFNFGIIVINLKEGLGGEDRILRYVPNASRVAATIADVVTQYQRRSS